MKRSTNQPVDFETNLRCKWKNTSMLRPHRQKSSSLTVRSPKNTAWTTAKPTNLSWTRKTSWRFCAAIGWRTQTSFLMNGNGFNLRRSCWPLRSLDPDPELFSESLIEIWICSSSAIKSPKKRRSHYSWNLPELNPARSAQDREWKPENRVYQSE